MRVTNLWLTRFRNYAEAELAPAPGLTVVLGDNGQGKTNLLEAIGYAATLSSFRGAPPEAMIRLGCPSAVVRAEGQRDSRPSRCRMAHEDHLVPPHLGDHRHRIARPAVRRKH